MEHMKISRLFTCQHVDSPDSDVTPDVRGLTLLGNWGRRLQAKASFAQPRCRRALERASSTASGNWLEFCMCKPTVKATRPNRAAAAGQSSDRVQSSDDQIARRSGRNRPPFNTRWLLHSHLRPPTKEQLDPTQGSTAGRTTSHDSARNVLLRCVGWSHSEI
jgi:hypothetical protein